jgi:hypothetical protein
VIDKIKESKRLYIDIKDMRLEGDMVEVQHKERFDALPVPEFTRPHQQHRSSYAMPEF